MRCKDPAPRGDQKGSKMIAGTKKVISDHPLRDCMRMLEKSLRDGEAINIFETDEYETLDPASQELISMLWRNSWTPNKK